MVFNWFRRQKGTDAASSQETPCQTSQAEQEQKAQEQQSLEPAESESTEENSPAVAEDYLSWAKAAYKNIQQKSQETAPETTDITKEDTESAAQTEAALSEESQATAPHETIITADQVANAEAAQESLASTDTTPSTSTLATTEEPTAPAIPEVPEAEAATTETAEAFKGEVSPQVSPILTQAEVETTTEAAIPVNTPQTEETVEAKAPEALPNSPVPEEVVLTPSQEDTTTPEAEANVTSQTTESTVAPEQEATDTTLPAWARRSKGVQERLERLKATAVEVPEPEPVRVVPRQEETTVVGRLAPQEENTGLVFDEEFLWSAKVLADQGRTPDDVSAEEISWLKQLRQGLGKTRRGLINQLKAIVGQGPLNQDAVMEIEALLLQADVGVEATDYIINTLQDKLREEALPPEAAIAYLKSILRDLLEQPYQEDSYSLTFVPEKDTLNIWLITGVNGAGKTTTIGKLAHLAQKSGYSCLIGAADTFRAAAVEQVKVWGERSGTEVIANPGKNTDPAAVVFDAIAAAKARGSELLLVDTAGRLQNKKNLMEELAKIRRIVDKKAPNAKVESLLVLDATLGQNGLSQAQVFSEAAKLSGVVLTKLDGSAKGGVALAVVQQMGLPIRFIGAGEGIEDLRPFSSYEFVEALLSS
ncbi:signal recognition particle-docking protein FtsY [Lyngbya aestuarii]|uniref:signal recognition particle-docking protein FtsY n=1 Tax=Lyngbya aestuarii TaxID=118322 RepID=UPI00403DA978